MMQMFLLVYLLLIVLMLLLILCEPGHLCAQAFEKFEMELSECDWYLLPIEMQSMYMIFLADTQNSVNMKGYGGIVCERETMKKVDIDW